MAPEIVLSRGHDKAVDYWACGILIYEMLCGTTPFEADSQQETFERIVYSQRYLRCVGGEGGAKRRPFSNVYPIGMMY